jgi:hypothetical protein
VFPMRVLGWKDPFEIHKILLISMHKPMEIRHAKCNSARQVLTVIICV